MPRVTIRTGFFTPDGREEEITEYLCDAPGCPNIATQVVGCIREIGVAVVVCEEHASTNRAPSDANERPRESSE